MLVPTVISAASLQVAGVVSFYMGAALVMVFVNKAVLNSAPELPLLFLLFQLLIAVVLLHVSALFSKRIELPKMEFSAAKNLAPVVVVNIVGLVFNTLCLRDVEASFFQIARGLQIPLTIAISSLYVKVNPSKKVVLAAVIVTIGFFLGIAPSSSIPVSATPSTLSLLYGVMSSLFIAIHAVLIKSSLQYCDNSTIQLAYWTNLGSAALLAPFIFLHGETSTLVAMLQGGQWNPTTFYWGVAVTGVFGFLLCVASLLSIKITSPVTHMFSSAARTVLQTLLGVSLFNDILTVNRASSIMVILGGTMFYTWIKSCEMAAPPPPQTINLESMENSDLQSRQLEEGTAIWQVSEKDISEQKPQA